MAQLVQRGSARCGVAQLVVRRGSVGGAAWLSWLVRRGSVGGAAWVSWWCGVAQLVVRRGSVGWCGMAQLVVRRGSVGGAAWLSWWCGVAQLEVRRGSAGSASACWKAGPSPILGSAPQGGLSPLSTSTMRKWREASANGD